MNVNQVEILLVEDNPNDAEMTIRALKKQNLANNLVYVEDGEEALDFLFAKGKFTDRQTNSKSTKNNFTRFEITKNRWARSIKNHKRNGSSEAYSSCCFNLIETGKRYH